MWVRACVLAGMVAGLASLPGAARADAGVVQITSPSADASLRGTIAVTAVAPGGTTSVDFAWSSDGGTTWHAIATDDDPSDGWSASWDTTAAPDGPAVLQAAAMPGGETGSEDVVVDNTAPTVRARAVPPVFSPNGDHRRDTTAIKVRVDEASTLAVRIENRLGATVRTLAAHAAAAPGVSSFEWRGYGDGHRVPDGTYRAVATATDAAGNATTVKAAVRVDTTPPRVRVSSVAPQFTATGPLHVRLFLRDKNGPLRVAASLMGQEGVVRTFHEGPMQVGAARLSVPVRAANGSALLPGLYRIRVSATDPAANRGRSREVPFVVQRPVHSTVWRRVDGAGRHVALTFDDCNDAGAWGRILSIIHANHLHTTFFCIGGNVVRYPSLARRTIALGNAVGDHTWDHRSLPGLSRAAVRTELARQAAAWWRVARVTPLPYFRPPYGAYDAATVTVAGSLGFARTMLWDVDPQDWRRPGASVIASKVLGAIRPGSVVVMHVQAQTAAALPTILAGLRARHLLQSSLPELFASAGIR